MKKILIIGSTRKIDGQGHGQHTPQDYFGKKIETTYIDLEGADINHNLNNTPYPLKDDEFDGVMASHVLEHLDPQKFIIIMKELHRICKKDSKLLIYLPHFSNAISKYHLTHYKLFGYKSLNVICDNMDTGHEKYMKEYFDMVEQKLFFRFNFCKKFSLDRFEQYYCKFFPATEIKIILKVKKQ